MINERTGSEAGKGGPRSADLFFFCNSLLVPPIFFLPSPPAVFAFFALKGSDVATAPSFFSPTSCCACQHSSAVRHDAGPHSTGRSDCMMHHASRTLFAHHDGSVTVACSDSRGVAAATACPARSLWSVQTYFWSAQSRRCVSLGDVDWSTGRNQIQI